MTITMTKKSGRGVCAQCGEAVYLHLIRDGICSWCRIFDVRLVVRDEDPDEVWPEVEGEVADGGQEAAGEEG